jgi:small subunit ribosomal protein S1
VRVKVLEIDSERRRLSLSIKRVEGQELEPIVIDTGDLDNVPDLGLSEDVFAEAPDTLHEEVAQSAEGEPVAGDYGDAAGAAGDDVGAAGADVGAAGDEVGAAGDDADPAATDGGGQSLADDGDLA